METPSFGDLRVEIQGIPICPCHHADHAAEPIDGKRQREGSGATTALILESCTQAHCAQCSGTVRHTARAGCPTHTAVCTWWTALGR
jgi:hypothetical protein